MMPESFGLRIMWPLLDGCCLTYFWMGKTKAFHTVKEKVVSVESNQ